MHFAMGIKHLHILLGARLELAHEADDFADDHLIELFIISYDVVNDRLLFLNHKQHGYLYLADLNRPVSVMNLVLNSDIETATSWMLADVLYRVGVVTSRGHWSIGPFHVHCDETGGWSWGRKTDIQQHKSNKHGAKSPRSTYYSRLGT